jgi:chemotaxis protein methyltransferase CheR
VSLSDADFSLLTSYISEQSAIVVTREKEYLLESRLQPICRLHNLGSLSELANRVRIDRGRGLGRDVIDAMTTNETYFFRDIKPFEALRKEVIPALLAKNQSTKSLRIWCGASSSGQEPYSIAMVIREYFPQLSNWHIQLLCTDLSRAMVHRTREGVYSQLEVNRGLPAPMLVKYFEKRGDEWHVKDVLKRQVQVAEVNLAKPWPQLGPFDLVFLRNVLIYFDVTTKQRIFDALAKVVAPSGALFLGGSESTLGLRTSFVRSTGTIGHYYWAPGESSGAFSRGTSSAPGVGVGTR